MIWCLEFYIFGDSRFFLAIYFFYLRGSKLAGIDHLQHLTDDSVNIIIFYLAGADLFVTAAAVFQDQGTDVHGGGSINDAVTHGDHRKLIIPSVDNSQRYVLLRIQNVFQKPVAHRYFINSLEN